MSDLATKTCIACQGGIPPLAGNELQSLMQELGDEWEVIEEKRLRKTFTFSSFMGAIDFVNQVAKIAEQEQHHPDLCIHYDTVEVTLWTHKIGGLHDNDFILAAKIDQL